jgi:hypothetical protein
MPTMTDFSQLGPAPLDAVPMLSPPNSVPATRYGRLATTSGLVSQPQCCSPRGTSEARLADPLQHGGERLPRHGGFRQLEGNVPGVGDHFAPSCRCTATRCCRGPATAPCDRDGGPVWWSCLCAWRRARSACWTRSGVAQARSSRTRETAARALPPRAGSRGYLTCHRSRQPPLPRRNGPSALPSPLTSIHRPCWDRCEPPADRKVPRVCVSPPHPPMNVSGNGQQPRG